MNHYDCNHDCDAIYKAYERGRTSVIRARVYCKDCIHFTNCICDKGHNSNDNYFYCRDGERFNKNA